MSTCNRCDELTAQLEEARKQVDMMIAVHDEVEEDRDALRVQLEEARAELGKAEDVHAADVAHLRAKLEAAEAENARYRGEELAALAQIYGCIENERGIFRKILERAREQTAKLEVAAEALREIAASAVHRSYAGDIARAALVKVESSNG